MRNLPTTFVGPSVESCSLGEGEVNQLMIEPSLHLGRAVKEVKK